MKGYFLVYVCSFDKNLMDGLSLVVSETIFNLIVLSLILENVITKGVPRAFFLGLF